MLKTLLEEAIAAVPGGREAMLHYILTILNETDPKKQLLYAEQYRSLCDKSVLDSKKLQEAAEYIGNMDKTQKEALIKKLRQNTSFSKNSHYEN